MYSFYTYIFIQDKFGVVATETIPSNRVFGPVPRGYRKKAQLEVDMKGCKCRGERKREDKNVDKDKERNDTEDDEIEDEEGIRRWHDSIRFMAIVLHG